MQDRQAVRRFRRSVNSDAAATRQDTRMTVVRPAYQRRSIGTRAGPRQSDDQCARLSGRLIASTRATRQCFTTGRRVSPTRSGGDNRAQLRRRSSLIATRRACRVVLSVIRDPAVTTKHDTRLVVTSSRGNTTQVGVIHPRQR